MKPFVARSTWPAVALLTAGTAHAAASCQGLDDSTPKQQVGYLQRERSGLPPECIVLAISMLKAEAYIPAAGILTSYLDFKVARTHQPRPGYNVDISRAWWMEEYPAAHALLAIGLPASDSLVRSIGNASSSDLLRSNAEEVLLGVYRGDNAGAVMALRQASRSGLDAATSARLSESAIRVSRQCMPEIRHTCEAALN
jgi:hypothetical protein